MSTPTPEELQAQIAALEAQLAALKGSQTAEQTGSGAIAQDHAVAASAGGVAVGGSVRGNIYVGQPTNDPAEAIAIYRQVYAAACQNLPLRGIDVGAGDAQGNRQQLALEQVYVDLDTTTLVPKQAHAGRKKDQPGLEREETRPLTMLEAVINNRRLVLLGDPGSGKSTFIGHLGLCLALSALQPNAGWLDRLPNWPRAECDLTPLLVVLRDFARALPAKGEPSPSWLWDFIVERLRAQKLEFAASPISKLLDKGKIIVLLDGLDEIPTDQQRIQVRDAVQSFAGRYPQCRMVATCRTLSYQNPSSRLDGWKDIQLAELDEPKIDNFVSAWYTELARLGVLGDGDAARMARRLQEAVRRKDLRELAGNPLLLTVMALVHAHKGQLPDARALLYEDTVDILLLRWEQVKAGGDLAALPLRRLLQQVDRSEVDLKRVLKRLAFEAQQGGSASETGGLADIGELRLLKAMADLHPSKSLEWAKMVMDVIRLRAGLLVERVPEVYTFPHRTFQEYLAGAHLAAQADFARQAARLVRDDLYWRQVILLSAGRLVYLSGDMAKPLALVGELCPETPDTSGLGWRKTWLAGEVLLEAGLNRVQDTTFGTDLLRRVRRRLVDLLRTGALQPAQRAEAGDVLGLLGDPRFRADAWWLPDEPLFGFVEIPAGPFLMGSEPKLDRMSGRREQPQHSLTLGRYYVCRFPVTVAQFRVFTEATGYMPENLDSLREAPTRPVPWVTWHEAMRYCDWLTATLRKWPGTPQPLATLLRVGDPPGEPWRFIVPSEAEWEKAARGADGRIYPWGADLTPNHANYGATGIATTSAVGSFAQGASPYGIEEMSGNVWEWTRSLWGQDVQKPEFGYPYDPSDGRERLDADDSVLRVWRGGSFDVHDQGVRCACRIMNYPYYGSWGVGFRVVLSPSPLVDDHSGR
ncbi:MAG: SUMF1/EgtB/PvdO family nonheme iron enzyme [Caldilineaceae bacterium]